MKPTAERERPPGHELLQDSYNRHGETMRDAARRAVWDTDPKMRAFEQRVRAWFLLGVLLLVIAAMLAWQFLP